MEDVRQRLGEIPAEGIRLKPPPSYAADDDALRIHYQGKILCELDDGVLAIKVLGWYEAVLTGPIIHRITSFPLERNLGQVLTSDGILKFMPAKNKIPDAGYIR